MFDTSDTLIIPQNALIRNRHTISVRTHTNNTSNKNNNNNNNNNNNIEILVDKFPLPPPLSSNPVDNNNKNDDVDYILDENIKKFNKPWEFAPEVASKEMNTIKVMNGGRIIDINPKSWSSVVKDACVQSNYPFYVPLPRNNNVEGETIKNDEKVDDLTDEKVDDLIDEKIDDVIDKKKIGESISDKIKKQLQKKKRLQQLITRKSSKIEETIEEYKDGEGFNYFEITILEKEDPNTNIVIGVATKPFPCYRLPGHTEYSIGYHSNNGQVYQNSMYNGWEYGPSWNNIHTTIGCGYKPLSGEIYFTFNGFILGTLFTTEVEYDALNEKRYYLFPSIGANGKCKIRVNFGEEKFVYINEEKLLKNIEKSNKSNENNENNESNENNENNESNESHESNESNESNENNESNESNESIKSENESVNGSESESESNYSDDENIIYIKNSVNNDNNPLGKWKDVRLEINEKERVWWNTTTNAIAS
ncbi:Ear1p [Rhizophagus irregularis DAOM 197198w]|uniref:Ear1p n=1 Tax=Rhizophagus irregularis (strain DAOM 197198w) TaxID=1432141 RepID=A0A015L5U2_RHIIW|nr:Ear1p [Rhizophagus irregularis DAOM 197198w]